MGEEGFTWIGHGRLSGVDVKVIAGNCCWFTGRVIVCCCIDCIGVEQIVDSVWFNGLSKISLGGDQRQTCL